VSTGKLLGPPLRHDEPVYSAAFAPDGKTVLLGGDHTVRMWDVRTGTRMGPVLKHESLVTGLAFSPDGQTILTGSWDGASRVWDAVTGRPLGPPRQHSGGILALARSPDGKTVVTGGGDGAAHFWPVLAPLRGTPERIELWVCVLTGMGLDDDGTLLFLSRAALEEARKELGKLGGPPTP
jgi:WD40 repeat protein